MPRLTTPQYLRTHRQLSRFWLSDDLLFSVLTATEQWGLHAFFQPDKDWPDEQLLEHRGVISKERPNLPHQAGRALARFHEHAAQVALARVHRSKTPVLAGRRESGERHMTVKAVMRPEPDVEKLARALTAIAMERQARADEGDPTDSASPPRAA